MLILCEVWVPVRGMDLSLQAFSGKSSLYEYPLGTDRSHTEALAKSMESSRALGCPSLIPNSGNKSGPCSPYQTGIECGLYPGWSMTLGNTQLPWKEWGQSFSAESFQPGIFPAPRVQSPLVLASLFGLL